MTKLKQVLDLFEGGTTSPKEIVQKLVANGVKVTPAYVSSILSRHRKAPAKPAAKESKVSRKPRRERVVVSREGGSEIANSLQAASIFYKSCNRDIKKARAALAAFEMLV